ncbi:unnamed protein product, partial [Ilex paraguariensis]
NFLLAKLMDTMLLERGVREIEGEVRGRGVRQRSVLGERRERDRGRSERERHETK